MRIIKLTYEVYYTYMNIVSSHRTSNGFVYKCNDAIETSGPYFSESLPEMSEKDKFLLNVILLRPVGYREIWEDDDCWAESFCGQSQRNHYEYDDCGVCEILNSTFSEKYQVLFQPTDTKQPIKY